MYDVDGVWACLAGFLRTGSWGFCSNLTSLGLLLACAVVGRVGISSNLAFFGLLLRRPVDSALAGRADNTAELGERLEAHRFAHLVKASMTASNSSSCAGSASRKKSTKFSIETAPFTACILLICLAFASWVQVPVFWPRSRRALPNSNISSVGGSHSEGAERKGGLW